jgi:hypothetical protein
LQEDQAACAQCGAANVGTKFCPDCGALSSSNAASTEQATALPDAEASEILSLAVPAVADEQPVAEAASTNGANADHATKSVRRVPAGDLPVAAPPSSSRGLTVWVGVACLLALVGIAVGAVGIFEAMSAKNTDRALRAQLSSLRGRVGGDEARVHQVAAEMTTIPGRATMAAAQANIAALQSQVTGQGKTISHIQGQNSTYANCIPELQTELNGLSISWSLNPVNASSDYFNIANSSQISHDCTKLLYGS